MVSSQAKAPYPMVGNSCLLHVYLYSQVHSYCCSFWQQLLCVSVNKDFDIGFDKNAGQPIWQRYAITFLFDWIFILSWGCWVTILRIVGDCPGDGVRPSWEGLLSELSSCDLRGMSKTETTYDILSFLNARSSEVRLPPKVVFHRSYYFTLLYFTLLN